MSKRTVDRPKASRWKWVLAGLAALAVTCGLGMWASMDPAARCLVSECTSELMSCGADEVCQGGMNCLMECGDPTSTRIIKQTEELWQIEVPGDSDLCSVRCIDEYPSPLLATFSRCVVGQCADTYPESDSTPQVCREFTGSPLEMNLAEHLGPWWRTHTNSWDRWNCSRIDFVETKEKEWELHIDYQVTTAAGSPIRRTLVEHIPAQGIIPNQFGTRLVMWDTETTEKWELLHSTGDARMFAICATTLQPRPRNDRLVLIFSREPRLSEASLAAMKDAAEARGLPWSHFVSLDNTNCDDQVPTVPF